ncbi:hypothetical protein [Paraliomyxa miuraensis]|uniref:hypothetical protein n=1 Tax=Paraliomyxa miuraensis TaxID=376150 RepID=UPI0022551F3A|nr:hypothetical protein [Paraliomyxa miuraensis]MCX4240065.1 hypothetical protein [Paraliomyxa miuraensis]
MQGLSTGGRLARTLGTIVGAVLALWVVLGFTTAARAERYGVVTLDLRPEAGDVPTHLCVVSEAHSARTRETLAELLAPDPDPPSADAINGRMTWLVRPALWGGDDDAAQAQRCAEDPVGDCRPRVELPEGLGRASDLFVACSSDSLAAAEASTDPRPLFILLEHLEGSPPAVDSVRLTGGVATIGVRADLDQVVVTARSLGGYYVPHPRSERAAEEAVGAEGEPARKLVSLVITPRCHVIEMTLPRTRLEPGDRGRLAVRVHGVDLDVKRCVGKLTGTGTLQVRVPQAPLSVGTIDIDLAATSAGKAAARFGARWEGRWPRAPFALQFNQVSFSWRRPECIYPEDTCPAVTLETGTACAATVTEEGCDYRCPGTVDDSALDLELPLAVTFEKERPNQRWTDTLAVNGQTLSSYVPADQIYLNANVNSWQTEIPGSRITDVALFGEDAEVHRYGVTHVPNLQLKVPGASCEPIRFLPRGDRDYDEALATVKSGSIEFGDPQRTARRTAFKVYFASGGGPAWSDTFGPTDVPPVYFSALGQLALQFRARKPGWSRVGWELRMGGTLGRWGSRLVERGTTDEDQPSDTTTTQTDEQLRAFGWARVMFEPGIVVAGTSRIEVGSGFGLGFSFPIRQDEDLTGDRINFIWTPSLDARYKVRRWAALMLQFRGVFGERAFTVPGSTFTGTMGEDPLEPEEAKARSLLVLFGTALSF